MDNIVTLFLNSEQEYIDRFCEEYKNPILTPDGFIIECKYLKKTAYHFCCGKNGKHFHQARASKILWAKYILMNCDQRIILQDCRTNNLIFFLSKRTPYAVICSILYENKLNLISGFMVSGKRGVAYKNGKPPYVFFKK